MKSIDKFVLVLVASLALLLAGCGGGSSSTEPAPEPEPTAYEMALASINSASTAEDAQAAYDDVKDQVTAAEGEKLEQAVANRTTALQEMADEMAQKDGLKMAADAIDTSDLSTAENIQTAKGAIARLQVALDGADDVSDADKGMYQSQLNAAQLAVDMAEQSMALMAAHTALEDAVAVLSGEATRAEIVMANNAVSRLQEAIDAATAVSDKSMYAAAVERAEKSIMVADGVVTAAEEAEKTENMKEMTAIGKALRKALGNDPLAYLGANPATFTAGKLTIATTGAVPVGVTVPSGGLEAGDSAGMLSGWVGMDYAVTSGTGNSKVTNEARVYTNQGPPKSVSFAAGGHAVADSGDDKGYLTALIANLIMAPEFTHSGDKTHTPAPKADAVYFRGTYDGAPGEYRCKAALCTSNNDGSGSPEGAVGWHFKPDAGAMVSQPDANYLYYGWWVNKNKDGDPMAASAFHGVIKSDTDGLAPAAAIATTGSATYKGGAAGKYAWINPIDDTGHGGHFTANATLEAKFGGTGAGVTGIIDGFRLNDGSEDPGWSVELHQAPWGTDGAFTSTAADDNTDNGTLWSINDNPALESGSWNGQMYDEMSATVGDDDGSNVPTTAVGEFQSEFSGNGRMVGAFGVGVDLED